jgi:acetyltransferase-like isoleucine patch superfamily enzyme
LEEANELKLISHTAFISPLADIEDSMRGSKLCIGERSFIDSFVKIKFAGGLGDINIGDNVYVNSGVVIYSGNGVDIGSNTLIAANVILAATNHAFREKEKLIREQGFLLRHARGEGIFIGKDVWLGAGSVVLDGAVIEDGAVIGACSLVRGRVREYSVMAGNPLKQIGVRQ